MVMGAEDCVDAVERLLRLGLKGEQEREVARVTVECCLQVGRWGYRCCRCCCCCRSSGQELLLLPPGRRLSCRPNT